MLVVTGIVLNHTERLGMHERHVNVGWILDWYGIEAPSDAVSYAAGDVWITRMGNRLFFDGTPLAEEVDRLAGAVALAASEARIVVATSDRLYIYSASGELEEPLGRAHGVPDDMRAIGTRADELVIATGTGTMTFSLDDLTTSPTDSSGVAWARPGKPGEMLQQELKAAYRGSGLTLERILLDLHSGRIFGRYGVYFIDAVAAIVLLLALSGAWLWLRHLGKRR